jgi:hypothetical protein
MLLKLLVKLIILCLGLFVLNGVFYSGLNSFSKSSTHELYYPIEVISEFLLNILCFQKINSWFAFSYILSALGFLAFVINDYFQKESLLVEEIKYNLSIVFGTLFVLFLGLYIVIIVIVIATFFYKFLIYDPYEFGWGIVLNDSEIAETYGKRFKQDYSFNFPVYIVAILVNLFLLYCLSFYGKILNFLKEENRIRVKFSDRINGKFSIFIFSIVPIYFVFTFPTIWVWLYPTLMLLSENKSLPNTYIVYLVVYSIGLVFLFYKIFKQIKKDRLTNLKAEIKEELMEELRIKPLPPNEIKNPKNNSAGLYFIIGLTILIVYLWLLSFNNRKNIDEKRIQDSVETKEIPKPIVDSLSAAPIGDKSSKYKDIVRIYYVLGNLEIADNDFPVRMSWFDAKLACSKLGEGWRLPTIYEFDFIYRNTNQIGGGGFWSGPNLQDSYWCSNVDENETTRRAYIFDFLGDEFHDGQKGISHQLTTLMTSENRVRAVRTHIVNEKR